MSERPAMPEAEKLVKVSEKMQEVGEFMEWLGQRGIFLYEWQAKLGSTPEGFKPIEQPIERLIAEFYDIDMNKVEDERRALIDWMREQ